MVCKKTIMLHTKLLKKNSTALKENLDEIKKCLQWYKEIPKSAKKVFLGGCVGLKKDFSYHHDVLSASS